jgi:hypothetical protein
MAENHGLDTDQGLHPRLLKLRDGSRHTAGSCWPVTNGAPKTNKPNLTFQGQKIPSTHHMGGADDA